MIITLYVFSIFILSSLISKYLIGTYNLDVSPVLWD